MREIVVLAEVATDPASVAIQSIATHSPWIVIVVSAMVWFARTIAVPMAQRHLDFMDATEQRERERLQNDLTMAAALAAISKELSDHGGKLSDIKEAVIKPQCRVPEGAVVHGVTVASAH